MPKYKLDAPHGEKIPNFTPSISECKVLGLVGGKEGLFY
jgi:hypothetical protein